jgi:hypothetical protein
MSAAAAVSISPENFSGALLSVMPTTVVETGKLNCAVLDELATELSGCDVAKELKLRTQLQKADHRLWMGRCEKGRVLSSYRDLYKPLGKWYDFCEAVGLNQRTALNFINDYAAAQAVPEAIHEAAQKRGIDLAAKKNRPVLSKLIQLGCDQASDPDALLEEAIAEPAEKIENATCELSSEERSDKAVAALMCIYDPVDASRRNFELPELFEKMNKIYSVPKAKTAKPVKPARGSGIDYYPLLPGNWLELSSAGATLVPGRRTENEPLHHPDPQSS